MGGRDRQGGSHGKSKQITTSRTRMRVTRDFPVLKGYRDSTAREQLVAEALHRGLVTKEELIQAFNDMHAEQLRRKKKC